MPRFAQHGVCCYAGRRTNPQHFVFNQQRLWADRFLIIFLGIFINETSIGFSGWADELLIPAQQQALDVSGKLHSYNRNHMAEFLPYIFIALGLLGLCLSLFGKSSQSNLKGSGILVEGIVFSQDLKENSNRSFDNFSRHVKDKITIRFVTKEGEWITEDIKQDFGVFYSGQYKNGDKVELYYNKDNPKDFYVDSKQSQIIGKLVFALVGLVLLLTGLYQLFSF